MLVTSCSAASQAIVASPFLELDWLVEILRSRIALRRNDLEDARRTVHRIRHTIDLLVRRVPKRLQETFSAQPRLRVAAEVEQRTAQIPRVTESTARLAAAGEFQGMIGSSPLMREMFQQIDQLATHEFPVVVNGPTGSGKELVARALHRLSVRRDGPFFTVHCAALPTALFETELFGAEAGAFTGADRDRSGVLETLDGGTLFLDGIDELAAEVQSKLLRFLETGRFRPVGSLRERSAEVRVISSSTKIDVAGSVRPDLYARLAVAELRVPPLSARVEDIERLAHHFLREHARQLERSPSRLTASGLAALERHSWPGNVRELETVLLRALLSTPKKERLTGADIEPHLDRSVVSHSVVAAEMLGSHSLVDLKESLEREYLTALFLRTRGDANAMMDDLGVKRSQLYAWFRKLGIDVRELRRQL